ncbi:hypothetical protein [Nocardia brasiliensis]|uniref:hypothetical protein n=1 Tax=Nocardia brasiliensis TaxID=37326 RepID=UPI00366B636B
MATVVLIIIAGGAVVAALVALGVRQRRLRRYPEVTPLTRAQQSGSVLSAQFRSGRGRSQGTKWSLGGMFGGFGDGGDGGSGGGGGCGGGGGGGGGE